MKKLFAALALPFIAFASAHADYLVQPNDVIGIAGDSITQQHIYSVMMEDYFLMCQPTAGQKVVNFGWSGEQAPGFLARLDSDVWRFKPTVMTTCYGMNDGHYGPINDPTIKQYTDAQTAIVEALKKNGVRAIVLGSSKCVDSFYYHRGNPDPNQGAEVYNKTLGAMAEIDKQIAQKEGVVYADVFGITMDTMKKAKAKFGDDYEFAGGDGVHPNPDGQFVMAYAFLKALGCDGNIGTVTVDAGANQATGTPGQEIVSCRDGVVDIKSTRYPFCFSGTSMDSKNPGETAAVTQFFPFNEDLNRYMLVVKGLTGSKAKVTWGTGAQAPSKEFTTDQLAKGINLASEFLQNPFAQQFNAVNDAVHRQQDQETRIYQQFTQPLNDLKTNFAPGVDDAWKQIIDAAVAQHDKLYQAAAALVTPIEHTIKIEPEP